MASQYLFEARKINKRFPGVHALKDVDFNLLEGEIHGLVGHNGAGKSTLVKVLTGAYIPESGDITLQGEKVHFAKPKEAIDKGIGIVSQEGSLIPSYNGIQNIYLGNEINTLGFIKEKELRQKSYQMLQEIGLNINLDKNVEELSPAQRKVIEILKIISKNPKVIIFDEPTAALSDKERKILFELMHKFKAKGLGIIFITHYLEEVMEMCDRITVMRDGLNVDTIDGKTATKEKIVRLMINKEQKTEYPPKNNKIGETLLEVKDLADGHVVKNVSFNIRAGEIVGLFGTVGSGRTELREMIFGAKKIKNGKIFIDNKEVKIKTVSGAIKAGMALIPDDRLTKALLLEDSVNDNLSLPWLKKFAKLNVINKNKEKQNSEELINKLNIKTPGIHTKVNSLSGGNKQKVSFGKWVANNQEKTKLFIFDEPTEGVDIGARAEMYKIIFNLAEQNNACLVISSDISEVMGLSDRIYIMREGELVGEVHRGEDNLHEKIISASLGG